jgi:hypothetical protein
MSHPLRQRLLAAYTERVTSPRELAEQFGEPLTNVSYHTKHLLRHGFIELVRTEKRRGATKHYYRAVVRSEIDDVEWAKLPAGTRGSIAGAIVADLWLDVVDAEAAGMLEAPGVHLARTTLELDDAGWEELSTLLREVGAAALRIEAESRERESAPKHRSILGVLHFPRT